MVDDVWTEFAHSYDGLIPRLGCYQRLLAKVLRDTEGRRYVIDAGCGTGLVSQALVERGHTVVGFDNNPGMLGRALEKRALAPEEARGRWSVMEGDVLAFPRHVPGAAEAVVLVNVLFSVREPERALRECLERLAPGGVLIATGPRHPPDMRKVLRASVEEWEARGCYDAALRAAIAHHLECGRRLTADAGERLSFFEVEALVALLRGVGFSRVRVARGDDYFGEHFYVCMEK